MFHGANKKDWFVLQQCLSAGMNFAQSISCDVIIVLSLQFTAHNILYADCVSLPSPDSNSVSCFHLAIRDSAYISCIWLRVV
jgi:hypothetical protein